MFAPRFDALMKDDSATCPMTGWRCRPAWPAPSRAHLRDARRAQTLYAMLEPYAGQFVDSGPSWFGATSHHLANLAATIGRVDEADAASLDAARAYDQRSAPKRG